MTTLTPSIPSADFYAVLVADNRAALELAVGTALEKVGIAELPPTRWGLTAQHLDVTAHEARRCPTEIPGMTNVQAYALALDCEATACLLYAAAERRASLPLEWNWLS